MGERCSLIVNKAAVLKYDNSNKILPGFFRSIVVRLRLVV